MTTTVVGYEPRGAAAELFRTRTPEVVIVGSAGTGKSLACLYRLHLAALARPGIRCLIVRKTAVSLGSTTLVTFEKKVAKEALSSGITTWYGGSTREAAGYRYSNGSFIVVGGLDKPEKIMSSEYDLVFADEATELTLTDWESIATRLRNGVLPWQQQIAACNPAHPTHWLKQRVDSGQATLLTSRHRDNPTYVNRDGSYTLAGEAYIEGILRRLTGVRRMRLYEGKWAAAEGLVYDGWDESIHLIDQRPIPAGWTRWWSVDFGYTNPTVIQFWAQDPDSRLILYREIYKTRTLVEDHAKKVLSLVTDKGVWTEPRPRAVICDHDAEDRATLEKHLKMSTVPAKKTVSDGIQAVQSRLKVAGDGRPRLMVMRDALVERDQRLVDAKLPLGLEDELTGYVWDTGGGKKLKEAPVKENDHSCDAMRYMVAQLDLGARPRVRIMP